MSGFNNSFTQGGKVFDENGNPSYLGDGQNVVRSPGTWLNSPTAYTNEVHGADINKDFRFTGVPLDIHDGTDNVYWTASNVIGIFDFASTVQNHTPAGTKSIDFSGNDGDIFQITGPSLLLTDDYVAITGWVYLTSWTIGESKLELVPFNTTKGLEVGSRVDIGGYVDTGELNVWQQFVIQRSASTGLGVEFDSFRFIITGSPPVKLPTGFMDDVRLQEVGGAVFSIKPPAGKKFLADGTQIIMQAPVDPRYTPISTETLMIPVHDFKNFFGAILDGGISFQRVQNGVITRSDSFHDSVELFQIPEATCTFKGFDPNTELSTISVWLPNISSTTIDGDTNDEIRLNFSDDFSAFGLLRVIEEGRLSG